MEPPEGAPVNLNPRGRADCLKDHLLRGLEEAKSAGLPLPLYITIIDAPSDFRVVLRANSYNSNLELISGAADQPFEYPLDVFISRRLYPVELEANEQFVVMNIQLSKAQNVIGDWMHSTAYPMLLVQHFAKRCSRIMASSVGGEPTPILRMARIPYLKPTEQ